MREAWFDVHGLRIAVVGDWEEVVAQVDRDLAWWRGGGGAADLRIAVQRRVPDVTPFADLVASFVTPRNAVYQRGATTVVDYFGRALLVLDRRSSSVVVQATDQALAREAIENLVVSRIGERLNDQGLVRLHALGLAAGAGAVAVVMPSGGGKSTLALRAIRDDGGVRLLSEDTPLLDASGLVHPFPMRLAFNASDAGLVPDGLVPHEVERLEFHPKLALGVDQLRHCFDETPRALRHLVIGRRTLAERGRLEPLPRRAAIGPLVREAVVGVGVYQGMEFVLQRGWSDVARKSGTAARRASVVASALRGARVWRLLLGRDRESNWDALATLLDDARRHPQD